MNFLQAHINSLSNKLFLRPNDSTPAQNQYATERRIKNYFPHTVW